VTNWGASSRPFAGQEGLKQVPFFLAVDRPQPREDRIKSVYRLVEIGRLIDLVGRSYEAQPRTHPQARIGETDKR